MCCEGHISLQPIKNTHLLKRKIVQPNTSNNLDNLEPGTTYHVKVLVGVKVDSQYCNGDATVFTYTNPCPGEC